MKISDSEEKLLTVLWNDHPLTVGQIIERVQQDNDWHVNTIKTMLTRLNKKGAVEREKDGKRFFYFPIVTREEIINEEAEGFLTRFFDGKMAPLIAHFADKKKVTKEELAEIEAIVTKLKKNND